MFTLPPCALFINYKRIAPNFDTNNTRAMGVMPLQFMGPSASCCSTQSLFPLGLLVGNEIFTLPSCALFIFIFCVAEKRERVLSPYCKKKLISSRVLVSICNWRVFIISFVLCMGKKCFFAACFILRALICDWLLAPQARKRLLA